MKRRDPLQHLTGGVSALTEHRETRFSLVDGVLQGVTCSGNAETCPLTALSCELLREGARRSRWHRTITERRSAIPRHTEINNHLARKIRRNLGVAEPERF